jgi:hypothetical protein
MRGVEEPVASVGTAFASKFVVGQTQRNHLKMFCLESEQSS